MVELYFQEFLFQGLSFFPQDFFSNKFQGFIFKNFFSENFSMAVMFILTDAKVIFELIFNHQIYEF